MLRERPNITPFLREMLDIIETRMLVVNVDERIDAAGCVSALAEASSHIGTDNSYQTQRLPIRSALPERLVEQVQTVRQIKLKTLRNAY